MGVFEDIGLRAGSLGLLAMAGPVLGAGKAIFGGGIARSALLGGVAGGITGLATGDNYSSTAAMRNFITGAGLGAAGGAGGKALFKQATKAGIGPILAGAKSVSMFGGKVLGKASKAGWTGAKAGLGVARFAAKHPILSGGIAGGAVIGGMYASSRSNLPDLTDAQQVRSGLTDFQNSASGLSLALHNRRHR